MKWYNKALATIGVALILSGCTKTEKPEESKFFRNISPLGGLDAKVTYVVDYDTSQYIMGIPVINHHWRATNIVIGMMKDDTTMSDQTTALIGTSSNKERYGVRSGIDEIALGALPYIGEQWSISNINRVADSLLNPWNYDNHKELDGYP